MVPAAAVLIAAALLLPACGGGGSPAATSPPAPVALPGPSAVVVLEVGNFDALVLQSEGVWLLEFYAPGCSFCALMEPVVEQLAVNYVDRARVGKVNVQTQTPLMAAWNILGWPTFVVVKDGTELDRWLGATSYEQLAGMLEAALQAS